MRARGMSPAPASEIAGPISSPGYGSELIVIEPWSAWKRYMSAVRCIPLTERLDLTAQKAAFGDERDDHHESRLRGSGRMSKLCRDGQLDRRHCQLT